MPRYALVDENGIVQNVIIWDGVTPLPLQGLTVVPDTDPPTATPGGTYENGEFTQS